MRMRTYSLLLVQIAALLLPLSVAAQDSDYGEGESRATVTEERGTVLDMPRRDESASAPQPAAPRPDTPPRGMTMKRVAAQFGRPSHKYGPVGQPPITRWDYPEYRVYFEYDHVLHAVIPGNPQPLAHTDELQPANP